MPTLEKYFYVETMTNDMMKILVKSVATFAVILIIGLTSCVTDSCTECVGFTGSGMQTQDTLICIDQFDSRGDYDDQIAVYEALNGACTEK